MENGRKCAQCEGVMGTLCGANSCGEHPGLTLLRWFLGLIILLMVFALGVKIGFYKGVIESNYGLGDEDLWRGGMMGGYGYNSRYGRPMMSGWSGYDAATPAPTTAAPKTK